MYFVTGPPGGSTLTTCWSQLRQVSVVSPPAETAPEPGSTAWTPVRYSRPWSSYTPWAQRLLEHKYYFDEIYDRTFVRPTDWVAAFAQRDIERPVIDAAVLDTGLIARAGASSLSLTQSGYFRNYVLVFVGGAVVAAVILILRANS